MITPIGVAQGVAKPGLVADARPEFASKVQDAGTAFLDVLREGEAAAIAGITGQVPVQQAVEKVLEAERAMHAAIAVRDKIVSAYLELSRMQI